MMQTNKSMVIRGMKKTLEIEYKRKSQGKYFLIAVRLVQIITTIIYVLLFNLLSYTFLSLGEDKIREYNISENQRDILQTNEIFYNYYKAFNIINIIFGLLSIILNIVHFLEVWGTDFLFINFKNSKIIKLVCLNLQILFTSLMFIENLENNSFFCNIKTYTYWFSDYNSNMLINIGDKLCQLHNYANIFLSIFIIISLLDFLTLYINTEPHFKKKILLTFVKILSSNIYVSLFYILLKNYYFYKTTLPKYNIFNADSLDDIIKTIIHYTQKHKDFCFYLVLISTAISSILFNVLSCYDLYTIVKACKYSLFIGALINGCTLFIIICQVVISSYIAEGSLFFCSYDDYLNSIQNGNEKPLNTNISSNMIETKWFCNLSYILYLYVANTIVCFLSFIFDFFISCYMVFSAKYASKMS
ncbi:conserved Plasmodium membrane protein, unknown function [Plasmodium berghei]|uniref:Uncharacterized protein n=2 Tax=Plasmodium berghei TaxID=5821 RepID=A0A509AI02_PLABA|nr:conserved Plasmodium membrane protein, unknown function [Plasmodium berghei ANKA]CXI41560.1 conserved Plasmodium membrane protein, unknown function [Plasmodium berghei]SCM21937.1 conserved Plasmodium membrane protein, unknown function [Plasmodium berghei]SCO60179.1 conserved Plasmodium membrane protein, unknown function [Plasmodium berghei]SCO61773.1 conserved Plasmodium membrane protein, unknown function [Plasmodium berghei]VUC55673.1 conserved Plasmodium membrane protein, unknown function|eukprot:XP_034421483.1 conserved Plasmodium membrane protein, unknown function [Plasmodium berghei ANKA]